MNCLCCGKELDENQSIEGWHRRCVKSFFGTDSLPRIDLDEKVLVALAKEATDKGFTVPGVQKKLSLHLFSEGDVPRLTLVNYPTGYILKPQVVEFEALPESEQLIMTMAERVGIRTVPHALIKCATGYVYVSRRIDRVGDDGGASLAMEDFCQLDLRLTEDKYRSSYERCAKIITQYSSRAGLDRTELFIRLVFCFLVGNSDMHLKNFSLIETAVASSKYTLSPAYDLLPVNVNMPQDREELALTMGGKKANIRKSDFMAFSEHCGIGSQIAERLVKMVLSRKSEMLTMCAESLLPEDLKTRLAVLIEKRASRLD